MEDDCQSGSETYAVEDDEIEMLQRRLLRGDFNDDDIFSEYIFSEYEKDAELRKKNEVVWFDDNSCDIFYDVTTDVSENEQFEGIKRTCEGYVGEVENNDNSLFPGSIHTGKDVARLLLALKCKHYRMGDSVVSSVFGMLASFLPEGNSI